MLFQKLKESGQKPVFMLRHIVRSARLLSETSVDGLSDKS